MHRLVAAGTVTGLLVASVAQPAVASAGQRGPTVTVGGAVATPTSYTLAELAALPQTTAAVGWPGDRRDPRHTDRGVSLDALVGLAGPVLPDAKNASLRVVVTVTGQGRSRTFALGELDPSFGDHDALVALSRDGRSRPAPELVVPGDTTAHRFVDDVRSITVAVESPTPTDPVSPGALELRTETSTIDLSAAQLAALPQETLGVSFVAGTGAEQHTETGPTLATVLETSGVRTGPNTWVAAVGSDGYVAVVTPAEASTGGRPLLISRVDDGVALAQPRLVTDGDVKGGRYDSGLVDLVIGRGAGAARPS